MDPIFQRVVISVLFYSALVVNAAFSQTPCVGGNAAGYPCDEIDLMAVVSPTDLGGTSLNDIWGWTDPDTGKEYAIVGMNNGTSFVDISNPSQPLVLGILPTHTLPSSWRDMKVYNNYVFVVSEAPGHGVQSFDLTQLRNVVNPPVVFSASSHFNGPTNAHNIVAVDNLGYMVVVGANTCSGGLTFINVSDPLNMVAAGCFAGDGYTHDAVCFVYNGPDTDHTGKQICIGSNEDTQTIVDITNKAAPIQLSRTGYVGNGYTHQGWITPDHRYLIFGDELDELSFGHNTRTWIMDITDLDNPVMIGFHDGSIPAIDHNLYVRDQYVFLANYTGGVRILDATNVSSASLTEIGYFDTYPTNETAEFRGIWGVYPYFDSGYIIASDINSGLFVLRPNVLGAPAIPTLGTWGLIVLALCLAISGVLINFRQPTREIIT